MAGKVGSDFEGDYLSLSPPQLRTGNDEDRQGRRVCGQRLDALGPPGRASRLRGLPRQGRDRVVRERNEQVASLCTNMTSPVLCSAHQKGRSRRPGPLHDRPAPVCRDWASDVNIFLPIILWGMYILARYIYYLPRAREIASGGHPAGARVGLHVAADDFFKQARGGQKIVEAKDSLLPLNSS